MDHTGVPRPVPRWLHLWAIATVAATTLPLVFGGLVTTFRVGMADPEWPTEPWYLYANYRLDFGYLVEHYHRIFGWFLGGLGLVLAFGAWMAEPRTGVRQFGLAALLAMIFTFGAFHGLLRATPKGEVGTAVWANVAAMLASLVVVGIAAARAVRGGGTGGVVRAVVATGMLAGMIQGLLGGLRVLLNDLVGLELSAVHGMFAQIVFALLIAVAVLTAAPPTGPAIPAAIARKLRRQTAILVAVTYAQIIWGAMIRHQPGPIGNRLHLLFAFVVVGFATLVMKQAASDPIAKNYLRWPSRILMGLITLQIVLGVEAWLGKFLSGTLPELQVITPWTGLLRTAHAHIGTWVLGLAVVFALMVRRNETRYTPDR